MQWDLRYCKGDMPASIINIHTHTGFCVPSSSCRSMGSSNLVFCDQLPTASRKLDCHSPFCERMSVYAETIVVSLTLEKRSSSSSAELLAVLYLLLKFSCAGMTVRKLYSLNSSHDSQETLQFELLTCDLLAHMLAAWLLLPDPLPLPNCPSFSLPLLPPASPDLDDDDLDGDYYCHNQ